MVMERLSKKWTIVLFSFILGFAVNVQAQTAGDVLRYSLEFPSYDAETIIMPGIARHTGFGAYQDNPASMALARYGYISFDLNTRYVDESAGYLGNNTSFSGSQTDVGDLGFVYKFPTTRGSLVIGAGYSQSSDFTQNFSVNGFNDRSTITDMYSFQGPGYQELLNEAAWDAFAIDDRKDGSSVSIFRFVEPENFDDYPGIYQDVEETERGRVGDYSAFVSAEVMKDFYLGASIGFTYGTYAYKREFMETDRDDVYDVNIIPVYERDNNYSDFDKILNTYTIDTELQAVSARVGAIYQPEKNLNIGLSYKFPSRIQVDETFDTHISTILDNDVEYTGDANGETSYDVIRPSHIKGGFSYQMPQGLTLSAMVEGVLYSDAEYDESGTSSYEQDINSEIRNNFTDVLNIRGGLAYNVNDYFTPRVGYGYYPSPAEEYSSDRHFISGGF